MSGGRGSRKNSRQSPEDVARNLASPLTASSPTSGLTCAYAERICQRPVANPSAKFCWAHAKGAERTTTSPSKSPSRAAKASLGSISPASSQNVIAETKSVQSEPTDEQKMERLLSIYTDQSKTTVSGAVMGAQVAVVTEDPAAKFDYLEAIGSINVDDPHAQFCSIEDSASDDGSDEFSSAMPLGHAGVFSAEEVVSLACDRMQRLRRLYVEELKQTAIQLKQSRKRYLNEVSRDRRRRVGDPLCDYVAVTPEQQKLRRTLLAMRRHRRRYPSPDNVLRWALPAKSKPLPSMSFNPEQDPAQGQSAIPNVESKECSVPSCEASTVPCTVYCLKHILLDRKQQLFAKCPGIVMNQPVHAESNNAENNARQIECGRLAVLGPNLSRGLTSMAASSSSNAASTSTRSNNSSPNNNSAAAIHALCSAHRILGDIKSQASS